jgi:hypothetical protein
MRKANQVDKVNLDAVQTSLQLHAKDNLNTLRDKLFLSTTARLIARGIGSNRQTHTHTNPLVTHQPAPASPDFSNVIEFNSKKKPREREQEDNTKNSKHKIEPKKDQPAKCARCNRLGHTKAACIQPRSPKEGPSL